MCGLGRLYGILQVAMYEYVIMAVISNTLTYNYFLLYKRHDPSKDRSNILLSYSTHRRAPLRNLLQ